MATKKQLEALRKARARKRQLEYLRRLRARRPRGVGVMKVRFGAKRKPKRK